MNKIMITVVRDVVSGVEEGYGTVGKARVKLEEALWADTTPVRLHWIELLEVKYLDFMTLHINISTVGKGPSPVGVKTSSWGRNIAERVFAETLSRCQPAAYPYRAIHRTSASPSDAAAIRFNHRTVFLLSGIPPRRTS